MLTPEPACARWKSLGNAGAGREHGIPSPGCWAGFLFTNCQARKRLQTEVPHLSVSTSWSPPAAGRTELGLRPSLFHRLLSMLHVFFVNILGLGSLNWIPTSSKGSKPLTRHIESSHCRFKSYSFLFARFLSVAQPTPCVFPEEGTQKGNGRSLYPCIRAFIPAHLSHTLSR